MVDLDWHDYYEIGIDFIDSAHQEILAVMRAVREAIHAGNHDERLSLSRDLAAMIENHFKSEEAFLDEVNFPGLKEHVEYHKELLVQANQITEVCKEIDMTSNLTELFEAMEQFLVDDIFSGDIAFKFFLEYNGLIPRKI